MIQIRVVVLVLWIFKSGNFFLAHPVLNTFSKIKGQLSPFLDKTLSIFIAANRTAYSKQHVLIKLIEEWKSKPANNFIVMSALMDLSQAFD